MNRQYSDKLMKIYELNAAIMDERDRWECYAEIIRMKPKNPG